MGIYASTATRRERAWRRRRRRLAMLRPGSVAVVAPIVVVGALVTERLPI